MWIWLYELDNYMPVDNVAICMTQVLEMVNDFILIVESLF